MSEQIPKHPAPGEIVAAFPNAVVDLREDGPLASFTYGTVSAATPNGLTPKQELDLYETTMPVASDVGVEERRDLNGERIIISRNNKGRVTHVSVLPPR